MVSKYLDDSVLYERVSQCISFKQEQSTYDFKRQWYLPDQRWELLHDILCMSNLPSDEDGLIIIGIDEENDYCVCDIKNFVVAHCGVSLHFLVFNRVRSLALLTVVIIS